MAESSDALIKQEIIETLGYQVGNLRLRIFPQSSREDQKKFEEGGLTFRCDGVNYGSCDAAWFTIEKTGEKQAVIALEGTDALNRGSSGNAQYQRFHHALGAVKNGLIGVYYLKGGIDKIQEDLYGMAYHASLVEPGSYLIFDNLHELGELLNLHGKRRAFDAFIAKKLAAMHHIHKVKFDSRYGGDWQKFAERRSTIIGEDYVIKHAGRMRRNFTDSSQRAGHIAVGEMYLTKYYFYDKKMYYLFARMTKDDLEQLDHSKATDKEWFLLRNEPNVQIKTMDDIQALPTAIKAKLLAIQNEPLKGTALQTYKACLQTIVSGLRSGGLSIT